MRLLVTGSRHFKDAELVLRKIKEYDPDVIIEGGASGADSLAVQAGIQLGISVEQYHANWEKYGRAAGPLRNQEMLDKGKPDAVLAFPLPDSKGTWDMVRKAKAAGIPVEVVE